MRYISFATFFIIQLILLSFVLVSLRSLCIQDRHLLMCQSETMKEERRQWTKENTVWEKEPLCIKLWVERGICG